MSESRMSKQPDTPELEGEDGDVWTAAYEALLRLYDYLGPLRRPQTLLIIETIRGAVAERQPKQVEEDAGIVCDGCGGVYEGSDPNPGGWYFSPPHPDDGLPEALCPTCSAKKFNEDEQVEEEGDWPELWIQRGDPLNPETWVIWGSAENDAVPYETDGCHRYVSADSPKGNVPEDGGRREIAPHIHDGRDSL